MTVNDEKVARRKSVFGCSGVADGEDDRRCRLGYKQLVERYR